MAARVARPLLHARSTSNPPRARKPCSLQLEWLARDLAVLPLSMPIVTFNHIFSSNESVRGYTDDPPAPSVITVRGKAQFRHTVANAAEVLARLRGHAYPLALAGHVHVRELLRYEGVPTRFEQAAAVVAPTLGAGITFTSGITCIASPAAASTTGGSCHSASTRPRRADWIETTRVRSCFVACQNCTYSVSGERLRSRFESRAARRCGGSITCCRGAGIRACRACGCRKRAWNGVVTTAHNTPLQVTRTVSPKRQRSCGHASFRGRWRRAGHPISTFRRSECGKIAAARRKRSRLCVKNRCIRGFSDQNDRT